MPAGGQLSLRFLGEMEVWRGDEPVSLPRSKKTRALLAYLVATGRSQRRDRLCEVFWDLPDDPRGELRWSLSKVRRIVDQPDLKRIVSDRQAVRFDPGDADIDLLRIRELANLGLRKVETTQLEAATGLFRGPFLTGLALPNCPEFQAWRTAEREQFRRLHCDVLREIIDRTVERPEQALERARSLVQIDPDDESAHGVLVKLLASCGRRREAEEQFRLAEQHFEQLGAGPSATLIQLRSELSRRPPLVSTQAPSSVAPEDAQEPVPVQEMPEITGAERKHLTILIAEIEENVGPFDDPDPESALRKLDPALDAMRAAVNHHGGTVISLLGNGLMALFGAPVAHEDHAVLACLAALAMRDDIQGLAGAGLAVRIGLHSGEAVVRTVEDAQSRHYEAVGPAVSLAREVERALPSGIIGLTAETLQRAEGFVRVRPLDGRGHSAGGTRWKPAELFELLDRTAARSRWEARTPQALTAFVGRDLELAQITDSLERADSGEGRVVALVGDAGLGKSRLAHEFTRSPATKGWTVLKTGAAAHDRNVAYLPLSDLLRSWSAVEEQDSRTTIAEKLRDRITQLDQKLLPLLPALFSLLDLPVDDKEWSHMSAAKRRQEVHTALTALFLRMSREQPLILLFEDLHWIDSETHAVLDSLVDALAADRMLILVTYRPEFEHAWSGKSAFVLIRSDPLRATTADRLLRSLLGDAPSIADLRPPLIERSGGNPLFLEEMVSALAETGALIGERGDYRLVEAVDNLVMPLTVREVLVARIDRLPADSKALLQIASVIGKDVPVALLQPIARKADEELAAQLATLQASELLYQSRLPPDQAYSFKHALTQEAAYQGLLREVRRRLHIAVVGTIEELFRDRLEEHIGRLALHALAGGLWQKAVTYHRQAGNRAVERSAYREASHLYEQALDALEQLPEEPHQIEQGIDIRLKLRVALNTIGRFEAMLERLLEAESLAERVGDHRRRAEVNLAKIWALGLLGDVAGAIESGTRAVASGRVLNTLSTVACADLGIGWAHWQRGEARDAVEFLARHKDYLSGERRFETFGSISVRSVFCLSNLARNHALLGAFPEALDIGTKGCEIAEELGRPFDLAYAYWHFGSVLLSKGEIDEAFSYLDQAYEINLTNAFDFTAVGVAVDLGYAHLLSGRAPEAVALLEQARAKSEKTRHLHNNVWATIYLAMAKLYEGAADQAEILGHSALEKSQAHSFLRAEALARQLLGVVTGRRGPSGAEQAEAQLLSARARFADLGLRPDLMKCHGDLASLCHRAGRAKDANSHLEAASQLRVAMEMAPQPSAGTERIWGPE